MRRMILNLRRSHGYLGAVAWIVLTILWWIGFLALTFGQQAISMAISPETSSPGELLWKFETEIWPGYFVNRTFARMSAAIVNDTVYFGGFDNNLYAVDRRTGQEYWRFR